MASASQSPEFFAFQVWMRKRRLDAGDIERLFEDADTIMVRDGWDKPRRKPLYVSGASDDLIEFEGSLHDETGYPANSKSHAVLEFDNGVRLMVKYDGTWNVDMLADPNNAAPDYRVFRGVSDDDEDKPRAKPMSDDEMRIRKETGASSYSDVAVLDMDWEWVRVTSAPDAATPRAAKGGEE